MLNCSQCQGHNYEMPSLYYTYVLCYTAAVVGCEYNCQSYKPGDSFPSADGCNEWLVSTRIYCGHTVYICTLILIELLIQITTVLCTDTLLTIHTIGFDVFTNIDMQVRMYINVHVPT